MDYYLNYTINESGYRFISINLWKRDSTNLIMCQEPDLNWWHEDFQSSALPAELSRPVPMYHPHFIRERGLCQLTVRKKITKFYLGPRSPWVLKNFLNFSMRNDTDSRSFKWGFSQRCSFVYIIIYITCNKRKAFLPRSISKLKTKRINQIE